MTMNREIKDKASQKPLWSRPSNPGVVSKNATSVQKDTKAPKGNAKSVPATKSLTEK